jgi:proteasome beta subunit
MGSITTSFTDFVATHARDLLPGHNLAHGGEQVALSVRHSTTIIAATCAGGVVMAADRRGTSGMAIVERQAEKLFRADDFSCVGAAGAGSIGMELCRLYTVELEHYEKLEGRSLSPNGKANRLANLVRANLTLAAQGLVVIPIFATYDPDRDAGRIFNYDVAGGPYEVDQFHTIGSGSVFAKGALKKLYAPGSAPDDVVYTCIQALYDAADDDAATGGPDVTRQIWPNVVVITADGFRRLSDDEVAGHVRTMLDGRLTSPDGPTAPLR